MPETEELLQEARDELDAGQYRKARICAEDAVRQAPDSYEAH